MHRNLHYKVLSGLYTSHPIHSDEISEITDLQPLADAMTYRLSKPLSKRENKIINDVEDLTTSVSGHHFVKSLPVLASQLNRRTLRDRAAYLLSQGSIYSYRRPCSYCHLRHHSFLEKTCTHRYRQDIYASLLARDSETVYVFTKDAHIPPVGSVPDLHVIHWPLVLGECPSGKRGTLEVENENLPDGLDLTGGVVRAVLQYWSEHDGCIPFKTHVGTQATILRIRHQDPPEADSNYRAGTDLARYIFMVSNEKMIGRMNAGKGRCNIFKILTARHTRFPRGVWKEEIQDESVRTLKPIKRQAKFIEHFWSRYLLSDRQVRKMQTEPPLFEELGRRDFHRMISALLRTVDSTLEGVESAIQKLKLGKWEYTEDMVDEMRKKSRQARGAARDLWKFMKLFKALLTSHLEWLGRVTDAKDSFASCRILDKIPIEKTMDASTEGNGGTQAYAAGSSRDSFEHLAVMYTGRLHPKSQWARETLNYLHSLCLYVIALEETVEFSDRRRHALEKIESRQIRESYLEVVDVKAFIPEAEPE